MMARMRERLKTLRQILRAPAGMVVFALWASGVQTANALHEQDGWGLLVAVLWLALAAVWVTDYPRDAPASEPQRSEPSQP